jgi:hypothetical protein
MERKHARHLLFQSLSGNVVASELQDLETKIERHLALTRDEKEARAGALFTELAEFTAYALLRATE